MFDVNGENPYTNTFKGLTAAAKSTTTIGNIPLFKSINDQPVYFLLLKCGSSSGNTISRNFYWLHPVGGSYLQLAGEFRAHKIPIASFASLRVDNSGSYKYSIRVHNTSPTAVAFGMYFSVIDAAADSDDNRILPVAYSNNWFSLVPNEDLKATISFKVRHNNVRPKVLLRGWNTEDREVVPPPRYW